MTRAPLLLEETSFSHSSLIVSVSSLLAALLGAGQALVIAFIVGEGDKTDAFLAAYALYFVFAIFGASMRSSVVPLVGSERSPESFRARVAELASRTLLVAILVMVALALLSPLAGQLLTHGLPADARWTAVLSLLVLAPAAFCQIQAAALSATLVAARRFSFSAVLYVVAGAVGLACSALLLELIGVMGAAFGLLAGAALLAGGHSFYMRSFGVRLRPRLSWLREAAQKELAVMLAAGSAIAIAFQANLAISLSAISNEPGAITAYSYAFFAIALMLTISSLPLALVTLPDLVGRIAREGSAAAEQNFLKVAPYAFAVLAPLLFAYAADAEPLLEAIFEGSLSNETVQLLYDLGLLLGLMAVPAALVYLATTATLALGRSRWFLAVGLASVLVHAAIVIPLSTFGPEAVAGGHAVSTTIMAILLLQATFGRRWPALALRALGRSAPAFVLSLSFVALRLPLGSDPGAGAVAASAVAAALLYAGLAVLLWPSVSTAFVDLMRRPLTGARR